MKKTIVSFLMMVVAFTINAQDVKNAKKLFEKGDLAGARTQVDGYVNANPKNAEGLFLKAKIYEAIAANETLSATVPNAGQVAFETFKVAMDNLTANKEMLLASVKDKNFYQPLISLYSDFYKQGLKNFSTGSASKNPKDFQNAVDAFTSANEVGMYATANKLTTLGTIDTSLVLNIGQAAIYANNNAVALTKFKILADANIVGTKDGNQGFQLPYEWLGQYYRDTKDDANFNKYVEKGKQYFPNDKFFDLVGLDYSRNKKEYQTMFKKYHELIAKNPDSTTYSLSYANEAFNYIYAADEGVKVENKEELLQSINATLTKTLKAEPNNVKANWLMGQYYYNLGVETHQKALAIKLPKLPADIKAKADINATAKGYFNQAISYLDNAIASLEKSNKKSDKSSYKSIVNIASQAYEQLQQSDKVKLYQAKYDAADAKFIAIQ